MDIVFIQDLKIDAIVGIFDWEREVPQVLSVDVHLASDVLPAAKSANIEDALDYGAVASRVRDFIVASKFLLLETLVEDTAAMIMREFNVPWVRLRCKKLQVLQDADGVGVEIERGHVKSSK